jgi:hypothetical protein
MAMIENPLTYLVGLTALDWQSVALFCLVTFSDFVVYCRHLSTTAISNRRQRAERVLKQGLYGLCRGSL